MRLRDNANGFVEAVLRAAETLNIPERQIEKDYWVSELLRALSLYHGDSFLFKGGTSLSKGWQIVERFSEEIDLLLLTEPGAPTDHILQRFIEVAAEVSTKSPIVEQSVPGRASRVAVSFPRLDNMRNSLGMRKDILLEPGVRGGPQPSAVVSIGPLMADGLPFESRGQFEDLSSFEVNALHPACTFVEKLFAVDAMANALLSDLDRLVKGTEARHFYDLYFLADDNGEALTHLRASGDYDAIVTDCEAVSAYWFPEGASSRPAGGFKQSAAFVDGSLLQRIAPAYERAMNNLCYPGASRPAFADVSARLCAIPWL